MVNIPCMFDMGITPADPCDQQLNLNIIDDITFHKVKKKIETKKKIPKKWKLAHTQNAIEALHHNQYISEVEIIFNGYSVDF